MRGSSELSHLSRNLSLFRMATELVIKRPACNKLQRVISCRYERKNVLARILTVAQTRRQSVDEGCYEPRRSLDQILLCHHLLWKRVRHLFELQPIKLSQLSDLLFQLYGTQTRFLLKMLYMQWSPLPQFLLKVEQDSPRQRQLEPKTEHLHPLWMITNK